MHLSKVELSEKKYKSLLALRNPNLIHGALGKNYPENKILWRIDRVGDKRNLLLMSEQKLNLEPLINQFGISEDRSGSFDLSVLLNQITKGSRWRFRIKANPVRRTINRKTGRKAYCHYMNDKDRLFWLESRAEKNGFHLDKVAITEIENIRFKRENKTVSLASATYDGVLTVTDPALFKHAAVYGIGHGKAYGLGMLSLIPIS